jgi:hypothetical protein
MNTFGEVSWDDDVFSGADKKSNAKDLFLRLDEGSNEMRIITQPFQYLVHKYKKEPNNPKDFGQKVSCSAIHGSCPLCSGGDKAKPRWLLGVISRKSGTYKILDVSFAVFSQIRKLARNTARWGDPTKYDVDIVVDKNGGATGYYSVQPISKEPLSAADQQIKDNVDLDDLKRRVTPLTPEQVQARIDKINGDGGTSPTTAVKKPDFKAKPAPVSMDDEDDAFPSYDA